MNLDSNLSFVETLKGVESHVRCAGKLWTKEHASWSEALEFAMNNNWLDPADPRIVEETPNGWSKAIETAPAHLKSLEFIRIASLPAISS